MSGFSVMENTVKVELLFSLDGQKLENVFHVDVGHAPVLADVAIIGGAIVTWWNTHIKPITGGGISFNGIKFTNMESQDGFQVEYNTGLPLIGTRPTGKTAPNNVTVAIRLGTQYRGRNATGRIFHIGLDDEVLSGSHLIAGFDGTLKTKYEALISGLLAAGGVLVVASQWLAGVRRPVALLQPVTSVSVDNTTDSQRRRLPGRGR